MSRAIGIDLGTTYSGAAILIDNELTMIPDDRGERLIPSMVAFNDNQILVGRKVKYQMMTNQENSVYQIKRLMGRTFDDKNVQQNRKIWPFSVVQGEEDNQVRVQVRFNREVKRFLPEELSSFIIKRLKQTSETYLKRFIHDAVISVPAYFTNTQKSATKNAGTIAGLNVKRIINEPTAAALAYGFGRDASDKQIRHILVYDLGGGTFDICVLKICGREFEVLGISGDSNMGGEDFTNRMVNHFFREFYNEYKISPEKRDHPRMRHRLREACEKAKRKLSEKNCEKADIELDAFYKKIDLEEVDFYSEISREQFEQINLDLFNMTMELVDKCLEDKQLKKDDIDQVILVGGSTRIPKIISMLEEKFTKEKLNSSVNPDDAVALGAAIEAAILSSDSCEDEKVKNMKLQDVTPLSLGIETGPHKHMNTFIDRNSKIPITSEVQKLQTVKNNQSEICFRIFEGEQFLTAENNLLGELKIPDIPRGPAGSVKFEVKFHLDENGILSVTAEELQSKQMGSIVISNDLCRLSNRQIREIIERGKELEQLGESEVNKANKKRQLEHFTYDLHHFLLLESTANKISSAEERKCRKCNDAARRFLSDCENAVESDFDKWLSQVRKVCEPKLKQLFIDEKGRNFGEFAPIGSDKFMP